VSFFPNIFFNFKARYCSSLSCAAKHAALGVVLSRNISSNTQPSICAVVFFLVLNCRNSRSPYIFLSGLSFVYFFVLYFSHVTSVCSVLLAMCTAVGNANADSPAVTLTHGRLRRQHAVRDVIITAKHQNSALHAKHRRINDGMKKTFCKL